MYHKKSLILLCRFFIVIALITLIQACANIAANRDLINKIYIAPMSEKSGMIIRNNLLPYFPNQTIDTADFIIIINTTTKNTLYLTNSYGYATKGETRLNSTLNIKDKATKKLLLKVSSTFHESFNIEPTGYAARKTKEFAQKTNAEQASKEIKIKIYSFLQRQLQSKSKNTQLNNEITAQTSK